MARSLVFINNPFFPMKCQILLFTMTIIVAITGFVTLTVMREFLTRNCITGCLSHYNHHEQKKEDCWYDQIMPG